MTSINLFLGSAEPKKSPRSKLYRVMSGEIGMQARIGWRCVLAHHLTERIVHTILEHQGR